MQTQYLFTTKLNEDVLASIPATSVGSAGVDNTIARQTTRNSIIKNFMSNSYSNETEINNLKSTQSGTIQSSALVMNGPQFNTSQIPINYISYVYKNLNNAYKHFGTRIRIIGNVTNTGSQNPIGSTTYYQVSGTSPNQNINIGGGSGGIAVLLNPETNNGYYFEIAALTEENVSSYLNINAQGQSQISLNNVVFYKIKKDNANNNAIPVKLWGGLTSILVDDGRFTGQYRMVGEDNPTVYDLAVEYEDLANKNTRRFYLYINDVLVGQVDDTSPLPAYQSTALFVRGSSKCMFENFYALTNNYSQDSSFVINDQVGKVFSSTPITANQSLKKYAMGGILQEAYLTGLSTFTTPVYSIYFEEFGTIMRECSYINAKFDNAYPALYAKIVNAPDRVKEYTISGFQANAYGAEFLIFNATDTLIDISTTTSNFLKIQGIAFTSDSSNELTVDDYFKKKSSFSDPELVGDVVVYSPNIEKEKYNNIKLSRMNYGKSAFSIEGQYIQTAEDAENLMGWLVDKLMIPRKAIGLQIFANTTIQLGDIVSIDYKNNDNLDLVTSSTSRFVVYNIEYSRGLDGPQMTIYLSEV
jgi:hypothetical protein